MSRDWFVRAGAWRQQGAGLPMAIFLITVMALIVTTIAQLQQSSGEMEALDILSTRAFYAAESGAQIGLVKALGEDDEGKKTRSCFNQFEPDFDQSGLNGCSAVVSCESEGAPNPATVVITSEGACGSGNSIASRTVKVKAQ